MAKRTKGPGRSGRAAAKSRAPVRKTRRPAARQAATKRPATARRGSGGLFAALMPNAANFAALTPISFLARSAAIHPDRVAVVHGTLRLTYSQLQERARR